MLVRLQVAEHSSTTAAGDICCYAKAWLIMVAVTQFHHAALFEVQAVRNSSADATGGVCGGARASAHHCSTAQRRLHKLASGVYSALLRQRDMSQGLDCTAGRPVTLVQDEQNLDCMAWLLVYPASWQSTDQ